MDEADTCSICFPEIVSSCAINSYTQFIDILGVAARFLTNCISVSFSRNMYLEVTAYLFVKILENEIVYMGKSFYHRIFICRLLPISLYRHIDTTDGESCSLS